MYENDIYAVRRAVVLVADTGAYDAERSLVELSLLCETAGVEVVGEVVQRLRAVESGTYVGSGRLKEAAELARQLDADLLIADAELSPVQLRCIEDAADCDVIDRTMLILDIFAKNAATAEGKLQVEQAQLKYRLPRLIGAGKALSRLGGGIGTRGPGETKLESDRRHIRRRLQYLSDRLKEVSARRDTTRRQRGKGSLPLVALVGYTNVGKSSLLNALTDSDALAENRLFATLDTTVRRMSVGNLQKVLLCDTVGFVSRLPHHLVEAFKSTLEEIKYADLIIKVLDATDEDYEEKLRITDGIIAELGCGDVPFITVFNKCDLPHGELPYFAVSAETGEGLEALKETVSRELHSRVVRVRLLIPFTEMGIAADIRRKGDISAEEYTERGLVLQAAIPRELYSRYSRFECE